MSDIWLRPLVGDVLIKEFAVLVGVAWSGDCRNRRVYKGQMIPKALTTNLNTTLIFW